MGTGRRFASSGLLKKVRQRPCTTVLRLIRRSMNLRGSSHGKEYSLAFRTLALTDSRPSANVTLLIRRAADLSGASVTMVMPFNEFFVGVWQGHR